jgi:arylsulfatase A-like enzyme
MAHLPIHTTEKFRGKSKAGFYGDVIETLDWSVGQVLKTLEEEGVAENTIVFFASDNGPWLNLPERMLQEGNKPWHQGSAGHLRGSKATSYEGGGRVPGIIRWPAGIPARQVTDQLVAMPDMYRTLLEAGGGTLPDHTLDGHEVMPFLSGETDTSPREEYAYFRSGQLEALRVGKWKLRVVLEEPELFELQSDPGEQFNRAADQPEIAERLRGRMEEVAEEAGAKVYESKSEQE